MHSEFDTYELPVRGMTCQGCVRNVTAALRGVTGVTQVEVSLEQRSARIVAGSSIDVSELQRTVSTSGYEAGEPIKLTQNQEPSHVEDDGGRGDKRSLPVVTHGGDVSSDPVPSASVPSSGEVTDQTVVGRARQAQDGRKEDGKQVGEPPAASELRMNIEGMHCASCVSRVESALQKVPGVVEARVNLATDQARIRWDSSLDARGESSTLWKQVASAVSEAGYQATRLSEGGNDRSLAERRRWLIRFLVALGGFVIILATGPLSLVSLGSVTMWVHALTAAVVQGYVGWPYYAGAWNRLRHFSANMDTLVALGTSAAFGAGIAQLLVEGIELMTFMDSTMILTFVSLGKLLETYSKTRASSAIRKLMELAPDEAIVLRADSAGDESRQQRVAAGEVEVGATILVRVGDRVPLDAEVTRGESTVDESWLTGEPIPVRRAVGDPVLAGTVNLESPLQARVTQSARDSTLAQVVELVRHAEESRTEIQNLADRVVSVFTPIVLGVALLALVVWALLGDGGVGFLSAVAVLIVACPCAMGLATPTAILVAGGRAAEAGILIKEARVFELAPTLTKIVFDKTGTITAGTPRITSVRWATDSGVRASSESTSSDSTSSDSTGSDSTGSDSTGSDSTGSDSTTARLSETERLSMLASVEQLSSHPLADAVVQFARENGVEPRGATELLKTHGGEGLEASWEDCRVAVGTEQLLERLGVPLPGWLGEQLETHRRRGATAILVAREKHFVGVLFAEDTLREGSDEAIAQLHRLGLEVSLLSGDKRVAAEHIAEQVGIDTVVAEVKPGEKQDEILRMQADGDRVAMVGDGINDAPALAAADLGIALGAGADVAIESADVVLVRADLQLVPQVIALSRATMRTIRQNLAWAFLYNALLIPLAAGVLLPWGIHVPPWAAAAAMATSSVSVVTNSLLLRRGLKRTDGKGR